jgi:hypothetical protein
MLVASTWLQATSLCLSPSMSATSWPTNGEMPDAFNDPAAAGGDAG